MKLIDPFWRLNACFIKLNDWCTKSLEQLLKLNLLLQIEIHFWVCVQIRAKLNDLKINLNGINIKLAGKTYSKMREKQILGPYRNPPPRSLKC